MSTSRPFLHIETPLIDSWTLTQKVGCQVFLKLENTQPVGSFKIRGIGNLCTDAKWKGAETFVSSSGGNAGYAAAYAGRKLEVATTVFVPASTNARAIDLIRQQGAEVIVKGEVWDETQDHALAFARETKGEYIPLFDHPLIWEGHSTLVDELAREVEKPDALVVSVGGGGLMCGILEGMERNNWSDVPLWAVETEGTASLHASLAAGELVTLDEIKGVAKTLGAKKVAKEALAWSKKHLIKSHIVSDREAIEACIHFARDHRFLVEPSCGATLALAYSRPELWAELDSVVMIICGGIGVDRDRLAAWEEELE